MAGNAVPVLLEQKGACLPVIAFSILCHAFGRVYGQSTENHACFPCEVLLS